MKKDPHLLFALRDGQWTGIRSVASGLACGCVCPACGGALVAKKGSKQQHHFAHAHGAICTGGLETALHRLAKDAVVAQRGLLLPAVEVYNKGLVQPAQWAQYTRALPEATREGLQLDVLLTNGTQQLAVEIKVSHATPRYKAQKLLRMGLPCVEIDASAIYHELLANGEAEDLAAVQTAILRHSGYRKWLCNPYQHRYEYRLHKEATARPVVVTQAKGYWHYLVYRCPLNLRFVRAGFRDGQSYARVFQDCLHCPHCREIEYEKVGVGFREISTLPKRVICGWRDAEQDNKF